MSGPKVLFITSEAHPLIKTGGLADVCGALPPALTDLGADVRLLLPGYRDARARVENLKSVATLTPAIPGVAVELLEGRLDSGTVFWLIDYPPAYDRPGNPYLDSRGQPWSDNAARFALLARVAVEIAQGRAGLRWRPDVVHGHDWQAGLAPALLSLESDAPPTVFTVHNLAYQGLFDHTAFATLALPTSFWSLEALEFHGQLSFIKGGLAFADALTTVSPSYAQEIQTPEFGCGLEGLLAWRADRLHGILNGIDERAWDPASDPLIPGHYSARQLAAKADNKRALRRAVGLPERSRTPLLGLIGRLVPQKGIDLVIGAMEQLRTTPLQLVLLGTGMPEYERALKALAARDPTRVAVRIGYDEALAHLIEAGADMFLMPSRFEPCGLNQMYSLRYGTVPVVHHVGGLADTVVDATPHAMRTGAANGFVFRQPTASAFANAIRYATALYGKPAKWKALMRTGMVQDFSWRASAAKYLALYQQLRHTAKG